MNRLQCLCILCMSLTMLHASTVLLPLNIESTNGITEAEYTSDNGQIYNITQPRVHVYLPDNAKADMLLLVCPGGAYRYVSAYNEGTCVADFCNSRAIAVAVLEYRLPNAHENIPLEDACAAMRLLRDSVPRWGIPQGRVGVMGFSAGGHLAGSLLTMYTDTVTRPDFGVLIYPVLSMMADTHGKTRTHLLGTEPTDEQKQKWTLLNQVHADMPPVLLAACQDDRAVPVSNSLDFYTALTRQKVPAELLILPQGGHGWGFSRDYPMRQVFTTALMQWLENVAR
ncbi:MAG: alpha/beta hydrolase [Paludibacter sp.]|nr:alpha/beta hydrolase [Bacteroidales bacterium]MCM1069878.1 alpha/beta hydrolase [Prevotella sp.]MCM1353049.1 alpha/beta hydrolase [Bacteroides sp.]MCM1443406.1 alpha/beta hydrolase [Muribaculum sp.]MCM1481214.1 alpha/beta hydrolase [Paludibacter sp.]